MKAGTVLRNRYQVEKTIGQGGMGCIYLAEDLRLEGRL
jgi:serine/threonine-protein kinase